MKILSIPAHGGKTFSEIDALVRAERENLFRHFTVTPDCFESFMRREYKYTPVREIHNFTAV